MMTRNNIPTILEQKNWSRYRLMKELGGRETDKTLVYQRVAFPGAENQPLSGAIQWETIKRLAAALEVGVSDLETTGDSGGAN